MAMFIFRKRYQTLVLTILTILSLGFGPLTQASGGFVFDINTILTGGYDYSELVETWEEPVEDGVGNWTYEPPLEHYREVPGADILNYDAVLDSQGNPHIVVTVTQVGLQYITQNNSGVWTYTSVSTDWGGSVAIDLNSMDQASFVTTDNRELNFYEYQSANFWTHDVIDKLGYQASAIDVDFSFDNNDVPYFLYNCDSYALCYGTMNGPTGMAPIILTKDIVGTISSYTNLSLRGVGFLGLELQFDTKNIPNIAYGKSEVLSTGGVEKSVVYSRKMSTSGAYAARVWTDLVLTQSIGQAGFFDMYMEGDEVSVLGYNRSGQAFYWVLENGVLMQDYRFMIPEGHPEDAQISIAGNDYRIAYTVPGKGIYYGVLNQSYMSSALIEPAVYGDGNLRLLTDVTGFSRVLYSDITAPTFLKIADANYHLEDVIDSYSKGSHSDLTSDGNRVLFASYYVEYNSPTGGYPAGDLQFAMKVGVAPWTTQTVDYSGDVGLFSSISLDMKGNPVIAYYEHLDNAGYTRKNLKFAFFDGHAWQIDTVETGGSVGMYTDIAVDSNNIAHISYYDESNGALKHAWADLNVPSRSWNTEVIDSGAGSDVGQHSSLSLDSKDELHIAYYDASAQNLMYAFGNSGSWNTSVVELLGRQGEYASIIINSQDIPYIAYYDDGFESLEVAEYVGNGATYGPGQWDRTVVDTGKVGRFASLDIDHHDVLHLSYFDDVNKDLKYASNLSGEWRTATVNQVGSVGEFSSIVVTLDNVRHITCVGVIPSDDFRYYSF
jgi:hypothetical protein